MEPSRTRVALLIDGDNSASILIPSLLTEARKLGEVMIRRVYGNWSVSSMHTWQEIAPRFGFEQRHHGQTAPGKNATDIALVVDAMDILYSGAIEHFCLVTSDSDYTPLVLRLRSAGCQVLGRQGRIWLERGTALVCHVVTALAHYPGCQFKGSYQCIYSLATSSIKSP